MSCSQDLLSDERAGWGLAALLQLWRMLPPRQHLGDPITGPASSNSKLFVALAHVAAQLGCKQPYLLQQVLVTLQHDSLRHYSYGHLLLLHQMRLRMTPLHLGRDASLLQEDQHEVQQQRRQLAAAHDSLASNMQQVLPMLLQQLQEEQPGTLGWGAASMQDSYQAAAVLLELLNQRLYRQLTPAELDALRLQEVAKALPLPGPGMLGNAPLAELHCCCVKLMLLQVQPGSKLEAEGPAQSAVQGLLAYLEVRGLGWCRDPQYHGDRPRSSPPCCVLAAAWQCPAAACAAPSRTLAGFIAELGVFSHRGTQGRGKQGHTLAHRGEAPKAASADRERVSNQGCLPGADAGGCAAWSAAAGAAGGSAAIRCIRPPAAACAAGTGSCQLGAGPVGGSGGQAQLPG